MAKKTSRLLILMMTCVYASLAPSCTCRKETNGCDLINVPSLNQSETSALNSKSFSASDWPQSQWWSLFEDDQLSALIESGRSENYSIKQAESRLRQAYALVDQSKSKFYPNVNLQIDDQWIHQSKNGLFGPFFNTYSVFEIIFNFFFDIDLWGKNRGRYNAMLSRVQTMQAEVHQTDLIVSTSVAATYFDMMQTHALLEIYKEQLATQSELTAILKERYRKGLDDEFAVIASEEEAMNIQTSIANLENKLELSRHLLATLTGQGPDELNLMTHFTAQMEKPFAIPENISSNLLVHRPDIKAQLWLTEALAFEAGVANAGYYPDLNIAALAGFQSLQFDQIFRSRSLTASLWPTLTLPIFTAGSINATINVANAEYEEAAMVYNELILKAVQEVADAISTARSVDKQLSLQDLALVKSLKTIKLTVALVNNNIQDERAILEARQSFLDQKKMWVPLYYQRLIAALQLIKSMGGGYFQEGVP
ncbi:MAG: efflux transporter outer membrane subunit [Parachlamydiales bacterium]|nr:efflux transporter outer membrane subunit [Parachlamydiales bacterium]